MHSIRTVLGRRRLGLSSVALAVSALVAFGATSSRAEPAYGDPAQKSAEAEATAAPSLPAPWVSCDDARHVAYRVVPPRLNPHNAFTHPIKVRLSSGQTCASLK